MWVGGGRSAEGPRGFDSLLPAHDAAAANSTNQYTGTLTGSAQQVSAFSFSVQVGRGKEPCAGLQHTGWQLAAQRDIAETVDELQIEAVRCAALLLDTAMMLGVLRGLESYWC
jgi:hypothetical protein